MPAHARILVVDDEAPTRKMIVKGLTDAGFRVIEAADGAAALALVPQEQPRLLLLDVDMPELDGFETLARLRRRGCDQPVLMLTNLAGVEHRLRGLEGGADDYLAKPFDLRELLARVRALLRRGRTVDRAPRQLHFGDITVDLNSRTATQGGKEFALTRTEFDLLEFLARHLGEPVSRKQILDGVWGYTHLPRTRTIETHIWRLRRKLGDSGDQPRWICSRPGGAYLLSYEATGE